MSEPEGRPCELAPEVDALLRETWLPGEVFGAIIAATVQINMTRGMAGQYGFDEVAPAAAHPAWPRRIARCCRVRHRR
ncbi:hypothetical protein [Streptomyces sp. NPDC006195]|uniref:hypothetical protein n=1 Tax=unclassified Streptomyces TaxID=2593676 RepID=UPI0033ADEB65